MLISVSTQKITLIDNIPVTICKIKWGEKTVNVDFIMCLLYIRIIIRQNGGDYILKNNNLKYKNILGRKWLRQIYSEKMSQYRIIPIGKGVTVINSCVYCETLTMAWIIWL